MNSSSCPDIVRMAYARALNEVLLAFLSVTHTQIYKHLYKYTLAEIRLPCTTISSAITYFWLCCIQFLLCIIVTISTCHPTLICLSLYSPMCTQDVPVCKPTPCVDTAFLFKLKFQLSIYQSSKFISHCSHSNQLTSWSYIKNAWCTCYAFSLYNRTLL